MSYTVNEIYYTLQGEGANTGRPAVFLRFSGCNLWTGREEDRASAICRFCDTDFVGGTRYASARNPRKCGRRSRGLRRAADWALLSRNFAIVLVVFSE